LVRCEVVCHGCVVGAGRVCQDGGNSAERAKSCIGGKCAREVVYWCCLSGSLDCAVTAACLPDLSPCLLRLGAETHRSFLLLHQLVAFCISPSKCTIQRDFDQAPLKSSLLSSTSIHYECPVLLLLDVPVCDPVTVA
jgi:hypothetical protein